MLEVYKLTKDERFLEASRRAADRTVNHWISWNNNYNSFGVWHLSEHCRATGERKYLEAAIYRNREGAFPRQLSNGAWAGHNSWMCYHSIIVRGFAALCGILPRDHEAWLELKGRMIMAVNHMIEEQRGSGHFRSCWDFEEWQGSRDPKHPRSVLKPDTFASHALFALVCVQDWTGWDVSNTLYGILGSPMPGDPSDIHNEQGDPELVYGVGWRWLAEQEKGEKRS